MDRYLDDAVSVEGVVEVIEVSITCDNLPSALVDGNSLAAMAIKLLDDHGSNVPDPADRGSDP